jgi:fatty acid elongase 3
MAPLADFILKYVPLPQIPYHYTHYVRGATPLSTQPVVLSMLAGYLAAIFGIREIMKTRQPQKLTFLFQVHNAILSSGSALLLVLMLEEILPIYWRHGVFYALCNAGAWTEVSKLSFSEFWERTELSACSVWNYIISSITISNTSNCLTRFSSH